MADEIHDFEDEAPSKSALKRESTALQELGEALCELSPAELDKIPIEDSALLDAIHEAKRIQKHGALRRHRQYIGKLMRRIDAEPLREALEALHQTRHDEAAAFQALEAQREALIRGGDAQLGEFIAANPDADRQHLRQLVREAQREQKAGKPPAASRRLFRYLRTLREMASSP